MRMVAIFVMVWVHFVENLSGVIPSITGFGAPLFSFLAGVSYCLWIEQQRERLPSEAISKISIRRGLFVFGVGIAFNVLVWLPEDTFNWDVLTLIGTALLILNASRHMPDYVLLMAAGSSVFVTPMLQGLADYNSYWPENYYDGDLTLSGILIGYFVVGYFPFFPWISYSLVGFVIARRLFTQEKSLRIDWKPVCWIGLGFLLFAFGLHWLSSQLVGLFAASAIKRQVLSGWNMFPPSVEYVIGSLGITLLMLGGLLHFIDGSKHPERWERRLSLTRSFSRYSFSIYILHHLVHIWPLWIFATLRGEEPTEYWREAMTVPYSAGLAILFLMGLTVFLYCRGERTPVGMERAMRWLCD
jgi:hypothetical protein